MMCLDLVGLVVSTYLDVGLLVPIHVWSKPMYRGLSFVPIYFGVGPHGDDHLGMQTGTRFSDSPRVLTRKYSKSELNLGSD